MKITIITAGWRPEGVKKVVEMVDAQTYTDWQHIIINDNNPELRKWLEEKDYFHNHPQRHVIDFHVRTHYYGAFARNCGAMVACSYFKERIRKVDNDEWLIFFDDDNEWTEEHLQILVDAHSEHPEATMIGYDIEIRGKIDPEYKHNMNNVLAGQNTDLGAWMYKKELFDKYGYFPASLRYKITYDWELIKRFAEGEGEDKVHIMHYRPCSFRFWHKER